MNSLLGGFFDTEGFMPHGYCLLWKPSVFWLNLVSDAIIALSYYSIPFVLVYFALRRRDLAFRWMFVMFGVFILACGTTHIMGIWTLWNPDYAVDGLVKAFTAFASIGTAIMLWPLMPQALALPSPAQLAQVNRDLNRQIAERHAAEAAVRRLNDELEQRVRERSAELEAANARLRAEIEERIQAEERLKASESRYRQVVEMIQEGIWIIADDKIAFANSAAARMFGVGTAADLIGMSPLDMTAPEDRDRARKRFHTLLHKSEPVPLAEMRLQRRDGRPVIAEIQSVPYSNDGHPAILAVARDMTQRREMEEQLRQSQKMEAIGQLTGGLAHDFNNLLTVVIGGLDRLESSVADDPAAREVLQLALSAGLRGAELTRQLLAFARKQSLRSAVVDLNDLVANMTALLRRTLGEKVQMEVAGARGLWPAETDATQLESALANLAINARDAMPNGGRLTIETANVVLDADFAKQNPEVKPGEYVMLAVSDTGTGIAPEHLPHVIEPFFTTKAPGKGSGLGLSMVYGFVKQSRGHMKVYSEVGHGTVVRLYFPRAAAAVESAAPRAAAPHAPTALAELVLVVEDNAEVRHTAMTHLTDLGYRTLAAASGQEAIEILARTPEIDVVFTDVVMPGGMTGWELGEAARRLRPGIRILYTSGFSEASVQDGRAHVAASHFLGKPYRKHELAQKLRQLLGEG